MRIVFMGTPDFAVESLKALMKAGHTLCAVVTVPDKARGRGLKISASPVKIVAEKNHIPVIQPNDLKEREFIKQLESYHADCFVVVAFKILPVAVFSIPVYGTVNVHASLLPAYRGAAPINWAIMNGETKSGVTTMFINSKVDTGDILLQAEVDIESRMNAGDLHDILAVKGAELLIQTLQKIENNDITPIVQDNSRASKAPKLNNENCLIDFNRTSRQVHNQIRGLNPYPAAYTFLDNKKIKIFKSEPENIKKNLPAGTIFNVTSDSFSVSCSDGAVKILELQIEGKKRMTARDFLNGYQLKNGDNFFIKNE